MTEAEFASYSEESIALYAEENVKAGIWMAAEALPNSRKAFRDLLSAGLQTRDNFVYSIWERMLGEHVGAIWIKIQRDRSPSTAYIYDLVISSSFRNRGYARQVLSAIEGIASIYGAVSIALHVFAHNEVAQRLYRAAGYEVSGFAMRKRLNEAGT